MKTAYFLDTDLRGSTRAACDANGMPVAWLGYDPFGTSLESASGGDARVVDRLTRRYTGQVFEQESGLYHYGARLYDDALTRFVSTDPQRQAASPYTCCANDPVDHADPDGRMRLEIIYFRGWFVLTGTPPEGGLPIVKYIIRAVERIFDRFTPLAFVLSRPYRSSAAEWIFQTSLRVLLPPEGKAVLTTKQHPLQKYDVLTYTFTSKTAATPDKRFEAAHGFWRALVARNNVDAFELLCSLATPGESLPTVAKDRLSLLIHNGMARASDVPKHVPPDTIEAVRHYLLKLLAFGCIDIHEGHIGKQHFFSTAQLALLTMIENGAPLISGNEELKLLFDILTKHPTNNPPPEATTTTTTTTTAHPVAAPSSTPPATLPREEREDELTEKTETPDYDYL